MRLIVVVLPKCLLKDLTKDGDRANVLLLATLVAPWPYPRLPRWANYNDLAFSVAG
jgi:hypothetical protein